MGFRKDFVWGAATAAYQIEGAVNEDGRGLSNWDMFCREPGRILNNDTGDFACDHYHRVEEDVRLMAELGLKAYRFSVAWPRIIPDGTGEVNQKGIDFYNKLIDLLLQNNIEPYMTIFHWDLPYALEEKGAWRNPESPYWFERYTEIIAKAFGDRVKNFVTFNEPQCFIGSGCFFGFHAPGRTLSHHEVIPMAHNVMKAHGLATMVLRKYIPDCKVGYVTCGDVSIPVDNSKENIEAAKKAYFDCPVDRWVWSTTWWTDPVIFGKYPDIPELKQYLPKNYEEDLKIICQPLDFLGQNIYNGKLIKATADGGYEHVPYEPGHPTTASNWFVSPEALYWGPKLCTERYKLPTMIAENGTAMTDVVSLDGKVHDPSRIDYLNRYLLNLKKAADDGVDILAYFHWSLMDNLEWSNGYSQRFGLIYIDYVNFKRTPKDSFYWYKKVIETNGENL